MIIKFKKISVYLNPTFVKKIANMMRFTYHMRFSCIKKLNLIIFYIFVIIYAWDTLYK